MRRSGGRKSDLIIQIRMARFAAGDGGLKEVLASTKGYYRKTVATLKELLGVEYNRPEVRAKLRKG